MDFSYESFERGVARAYERVILDALIGDPTLFIRADEVGRSWRIVDPVMQYWAPTTGPSRSTRRRPGARRRRTGYRARRPELAKGLTATRETTPDLDMGSMIKVMSKRLPALAIDSPSSR